MKNYFFTAVASLLLASGLQAQTITFPLQDAETYPGSGTDYNDFSNSDDIDPNGLVKLSTGSFVFFDSEGTADPAGSGPDVSGDTGDFLVLFDPDDAGGGLARFEVLLPENGATSFNSVTGITPTTIDIRVSDIVANSNDDLYIAVSDADAAGAIPHFIVKLPSTGPDTYGAPILVADETRVGTSDLASQLDLAIKEDSGDTIFFTLDDEAADTAAANDSSNFIYSLPGSAMNDTAPVALTNSSFADLMTALGGTGGTDKTDVDSLAYIAATDQLAISNGGNTDNDIARGDIALYDLNTNTYTAIIDASSLPGTPTSGVPEYDAVNGYLAVLWHIGASSASPAENDRIDVFTLGGVYVDTVVTEDDIQAEDANIGDITLFGSPLEIDSTGDYFFFQGGSGDSIIQIVPDITADITTWDLY